LKIYISHGSVATQLRFSRIFTNHFIANCSHEYACERIFKIGQYSAKIWTKVVSLFYGPWYIYVDSLYIHPSTFCCSSDL